MMKRVFVVVLLVSLMASVASASWYWEGDVSTLWSNWENWNDNGTGTPTSDHSATTRINVPGTSGVYELHADEDDTMGYLHIGRNDSGGTLSNANVYLDNDVTLNVSTSSGELVSVAYTAGYTNNLNVSNGRLNVWHSSTVGAGEIRLNHIYNSTCVGNLNLSGGIVDVEVLNKGDRNGGGDFTGTGGTLIVRDEIDKFAKVSEGYGFYLGGTTLEIASASNRSSEIGSIEIGNSQDTELIMSNDSTLVLDLGDASGTAGTDWDLLTSWADFTIDGELIVHFAVAPDIGDSWDVWKIHAGDEATYDGSGVFDTITPDYGIITTSWVGTSGNDTLRLTYTPEPATLVLFGLGSLIAVRRRKK